MMKVVSQAVWTPRTAPRHPHPYSYKGGVVVVVVQINEQLAWAKVAQSAPKCARADPCQRKGWGGMYLYSFEESYRPSVTLARPQNGILATSEPSPERCLIAFG